MAEEQWKIIFSEEGSSGGSSGGTSTGTNKDQQDANKAVKEGAPHWAAIGKFAAGLTGVVGVIAFVFQMIRRSKVFSTFMDSFLTILSAVVDILMIPLIPLLAPVLKLLLKLIPLSMEVSKAIDKFLKNPWQGIKDLFAGMGKGIENIFKWLANLVGGGTLGNMFAGIGEKLSKMYTEIGQIWGNTGEEIGKIWSNEGLTTWQKIGLTASTIWGAIKENGILVFNTMKDIWKTVVVPAATEFWDKSIVPWWQNTAMPKIIKIWEEFKENTLIPKWIEFQDFIKLKTSEGWDWVKTKADETWNWIQEKFQTFVISPLRQQIERIMGYIAAIGVGALAGGAVGGLPGMIVGGGVGFGVHKLFEMLGISGKALGDEYISKTGLYMLHKGEAVIPASQNDRNTTNKSMNIQNIFNFIGKQENIASEIQAALDDSLKKDQLRGYV